MKIKKLSSETINLISAGEVIEGPADILKELIENSVDASATEITVEVKGAGIDLISIKDNGSGIDKDDLEICLEKYTTSKLEKIDDLYKINSFGFRGEALSTINAVSKLKIISATKEDGSGYLLEKNIVKEVSANKGTTIIVEDLFFNVPVRKKFLKSKSFEFSKVYDIFLANVLLNPEITFKFISEKKNIVFPKTTLENRYSQIYGSEILKKTINLNINNTFFSVKGILTNPEDPIYLPTNFLFINKRYVFSPQIYKVITSAYKDYLMIQQKPFFILFTTFNPETIDVNVHPKKRFVKLQNELLFLEELKKELSNILDEKLGRKIQPTEFNSLKDFLPSLQKQEYNYSNQFSENHSFYQKPTLETNYHFQKNLFINTANPELQINLNEPLQLFEYSIKNVFGQLKETFILCETDVGLLLIDQHAADERINLEKNRQLYKNIEKQRLISPIVIKDVTESYLEILEKKNTLIEELGFEYYIKEDFVNITIIPLFLNKFFDKNIFLNLLKDLEEGTSEVLKLKDNLLKLKSCKESIKANDKLTLQEQINLIKKLNLCSDKGICAHGRPTMISLSIKDLEKIFKRIV